jgi:DNA polymerase-3 subunit delta
MDITEYKSRLKSGDLAGIYLFAGEEDYLVRYYLGELRKTLDPDPSLAIFNNPVFEGEEVDFGELVEAVKSPPMMADYKLIEWRHADFASMNEKELEALSELIELAADYPYSILAFTAEGERVDFGTPKKPSKFISSFGRRMNVLRFEKSNENQLYAWLKKHFDVLGVEVNMEVLRAMVFRVGKSMDTLLSEAHKLSYLVLSRGGGAVTLADVADVCQSTTESDTFALSNAITDRNKSAAYTALEDLKFRRVDPTVIFAMIARTFDDILAVALLLEEGESLQSVEQTLRMNSYKLKIYAAAAKKYSARALTDIVSELARADADSKYGGVTSYTAIELFISRNL